MANNKTFLGEKTSLVPKMEHSINDYYKFKTDKTQFLEMQQAARTTPLTNRIIAQRQLNVSIDVLRQKRIAISKWEKDVDGDWEVLRDKQLQHRHVLMHFNGFIKENNDKRKRGESKIKKEQDTHVKQINEIGNIKRKVETYKTIEKELSDNVKEYELYKEFLLKAANRSDNFVDIKEIIDRHEILAKARYNLGQQQADALETVQRTRQNLTNSAELHYHTIKTLHTKLAALRDRRETAKSLAAKWDSALTSVRIFSAEKAIQVQQVENSCWDLYKTMCQLQKEPMYYHRGDTENQLIFISERIKKVKQIFEIASNKNEKHNPPSVGHTASTSIHIL